jgi:2-polyprenyl-6-hydroxyphenyl methylase/3-demethylubiquinone-9 3-methyltransferase
MGMGFDFGQNWLEFSQRALTPERAEQALMDFGELTNGIKIKGKSFLDIGFGQGLSLLAAARIGANVVGNDINEKCIEALEHSASCFPEINLGDIPIVIGSILDKTVVSELRGKSRNGSGFDIVHSWGVLHHTGAMRKAMRNAAGLVSPGGHMVVALYNEHWTSPIWRWVKSLYTRSPASTRKLLIGFFFPVVWTAKLSVTRNNPKRQKRGMDFYYDLVDWIGGYPYEYISIEKVESLFALLGFRKIKMKPCDVPTGCNEFVFQKE